MSSPTRTQLASLRSLLALSVLMMTDLDAMKVVKLASTATVSLAQSRTEAVYLDGKRVMPTGPGQRLAQTIDAQVGKLPPEGGPVAIEERAWGWVFPLVGLYADVGCLVVSAHEPPGEHETFLLRALGQQAGVAITLARLREGALDATEKLRIANESLTRSLAIYRGFTHISSDGVGEAGIAAALHKLTGRTVIIQDRFGMVRCSAGPEGQKPPTNVTEGKHRRLVERLLKAVGPIADGGRLVALARSGSQDLGTIAILDPASPTADYELEALKHAASVLSAELMRLASLAEVELRLGGDVVNMLVTGAPAESTAHRVEALDYSLEQLRHVVVVEGGTRTNDPEVFFQAIRRAALDTGLGGLIGYREATIVLVCDSERRWVDFRRAALAALPGGRCRVGIGGDCTDPSELPRSYREALLALRLEHRPGDAGGVTLFDELGIFQLINIQDVASIQRVIRQWLGPILDYDELRHADLIMTLSVFLDVGGHYARAARQLSLHESTLKYRLRRIREISGLDIGDAEVRFNLQVATRAWRTLEAVRTLPVPTPVPHDAAT